MVRFTLPEEFKEIKWLNNQDPIKSPTLVFHGELDRWTTAKEIKEIMQNLPPTKKLVIFPKAGHGLLITFDRERWITNIDRFLAESLEK